MRASHTTVHSIVSEVTKSFACQKDRFEIVVGLFNFRSYSLSRRFFYLGIIKEQWLLGVTVKLVEQSLGKGGSQANLTRGYALRKINITSALCCAA